MHRLISDTLFLIGLGMNRRVCHVQMTKAKTQAHVESLTITIGDFGTLSTGMFNHDDGTVIHII